MKKIKILFIYDEMRTFIKKDLELLQKHFIVKQLKYTGKKDIIKILFGVLTTDVNFSWFALGYATVAVFFSKIFKKKSVVVAGGWDVVSMPEIGYGAMRSTRHKKRATFALNYSDKVLAVSESIKKDALQYAHGHNIEVLYHGFDINKYTPNGLKEKLVITVGGVTNQTLQRKGLETFVKSAKYLPDIRFILIGKHIDRSIDYLRSIASSNVEFTGFVTDEELIKYYQKAKVYVQVSAHEGFGCSLAEAMLCECVPVVTDRGAIPEVVGDTGFYAAYNNPKDTALKIKEALDSNLGRTARERITRLYPLEKREKELIKAINSLV